MLSSAALAGEFEVKDVIAVVVAYVTPSNYRPSAGARDHAGKMEAIGGYHRPSLDSRLDSLGPDSARSRRGLGP